METDNENKRGLTFEQVQKIIDGQIAKIEEEEKNKGVKMECEDCLSDATSFSPRGNGFKIFFKRLFNIK